MALAVLVLAAAVGLGASATATARYPMESMWYVVNSDASVRSFIRNARHVTIVAPHALRVDAQGAVTGRVSAALLRVAREGGIRVMPVVTQPGFDRAVLNRLLHDPAARARAASEMARLCAAERFWGMQFDFEHIHVDDRDAFTGFYREAARALHGSGCVASAAVVPRTSATGGASPYHQWMHTLWRGAYDYRALADAGDFLTLMAYDQHTRYTPPGPVAGLDWVESTVKYLLAEGVPPGKVLLGVPAYSRAWSAVPTEPGEAPTAGLWAAGLTHGQAVRLMVEHGAAPRWDARSRSYSAVWQTDGVNEHLALEDARTFRSRLALVRRYGLRGFSAWRMGHEDPGVWKVLRFQALRGR
jgi:spore germination protein YaaH